MVKLQWLRINKFRRVKPGTLLTFNPGYNVLLGQNGTGKTTLLTLVSAVVNSDFSAFIDEEFEFEYELMVDEANIQFLVKNDDQQSPREAAHPLRLPIDAILPLDSVLLLRGGAGRLSLSVRVRIHLEALSIPAVVFNIAGTAGTVALDVEPLREIPFETRRVESGHILVPIVFHAFNDGIVALFNGEDYEGYVENGWAPAHERNVGHIAACLLLGRTCRFDESLGYFSSLSGGEIEIGRRGEQEPLMLMNANLPQSILTKLFKAAQDAWGGTRYTIDGVQIPFLRKLIDLFGFVSAEVVFEFEQVSQDTRAGFLRSGSQRLFFAHEGGWKISDKYLSYGQKRMLAFMYYLEQSRDVAVVDELINGLHHNWIQACIEELGQRQVFLTSQNPLLLDYLTFDSPEEVRSRFVLCRWDQHSKQMVWENMPPEAAEDFFASYKVGFQQVGELLQSKGLW